MSGFDYITPRSLASMCLIVLSLVSEDSAMSVVVFILNGLAPET